MSKELEEALDECLNRLGQGEGVEECLGRYPALRGELEPLLRVAARGQQVLGSPHPSPQAKARGKARLLASLGSGASGQALPRPRARRWGFLPRGLALGLASLMALVMLTGGVVAASWGSLPGQALYGVKEATEGARLGLTPSPSGKARYLVEMAERRMGEIEALEERGKMAATAGPRQRLRVHLGRVRVLSGGLGPEETQEVIVLMEVRLAGHRGRLGRKGLGGPPGRPFPGLPPAALPTPVPAPLPTPTPEAEHDYTGLGGAAGPAGPEGPPDKAEALPTPFPTQTPTPLPTPSPAPGYGLAAAVEDYEEALQELVREVEKRPHPRPPQRKRR